MKICVRKQKWEVEKISFSFFFKFINGIACAQLENIV